MSVLPRDQTNYLLATVAVPTSGAIPGPRRRLEIPRSIAPEWPASQRWSLAGWATDRPQEFLGGLSSLTGGLAGFREHRLDLGGEVGSAWEHSVEERAAYGECPRSTAC